MHLMLHLSVRVNIVNVFLDIFSSTVLWEQKAGIFWHKENSMVIYEFSMAIYEINSTKFLFQS